VGLIFAIVCVFEARRAAMESMMTARQVADLLGVHENWVYDQAVAGDLPSYKLGGSRRFDPEELRGWIAAHREAERASEAKRRRRRVSAAASAENEASRIRKASSRKHQALDSEGERPKHRNSKHNGAEARESGEAQARLFEA
jgi:excisionase family DNA binding protein